MSKFYDVQLNPPKRSGEYLVHMCCNNDPQEDLMDVDWYNAKTKKWSSEWSSDMTRKQWARCPKPKGYIGQIYKGKSF